jgi:LuxR family transcriptional regulator, maltose regulon positive regulatory protein
VDGDWTGCEQSALLTGDLLATKLHVPSALPGFVVRPRLAGRLDEGLATGLILVCAPAGSGKTSLVADWVRAGTRPAAWLSLDPGDSDPARFWRHAAAALDLARPGIGKRVAPLFSSAELAPSGVLVSVLINELAEEDDEVLLVLDDFHLIDSSELHDSVAFLLEHRPPGLTVVLTSRSEPSLPLARLRARGRVTELRAAELRFTVAEATVLLGLADDIVSVLAARTEGWAAGLRLAALSLRGQPDAARFVADFGGSNRYVLDYLTEEVLDQQPDDVRAFLLETSVLESLSGELCDAVTGRSGSQQLLERIERDGLFLIPLDEVRGWWRYHHLFADLLRARLVAERPARAAGPHGAVSLHSAVSLHGAAATWYEKHGLADDAIRHALAAGDTDEAARLIERHFDAAYMTGERATIQRWLSAVPASLTAARPRLRLAHTFAALVYGDVTGAAALLDGVDPSDAGPFESSVGDAASLLVNVPAAFAICRAWLCYLRGDPDGMAEFAGRARAMLGHGQVMLESVYQLNLALADWLHGKLASAEREFTALVASWRGFGESSLAARSCRFLAQVQRDQGRLAVAFATCQETVAIAEDQDQPRLPIAAYGYVGLAEIAYQRDELADALRYVTEGIARGRQLSEREPLASGLVALAWIRQAGGDLVGAVAAIEEAERVAPSPAVASLLNPVPAQRARLLLAQGDIAAAARWTAQRGLDPDDEPLPYLREQEYLVLARVLIAQGSPDRALVLLDRLHAAAAEQERLGSVIELLSLRAAALAACGDEPAAAAVLTQALALGRPRGYVRVFVDEGAPLKALLSRLDPGLTVGTPRIRQPGLVDPLTARELEVLALLAAGASNQAIAARLVVTIDTVKKHVTHVLAKLTATNRTEAVARARHLGLLP